MKSHTHVFMTILAACIFASAAHAQPNEKRVIVYAQRIRVSILDAKLPRQTTERWYRGVVGPKADISWNVNDCGEQTGTAADVGRAFPMCVEMQAKLADGRTVGISIGVGTYKRGIYGRPRFFYGYLQERDQVKEVRRLHELPSLISQPAKS